MPLDTYIPYKKPEKISKTVAENFSAIIKQTWNSIKPKPKQFLKIGEYICLKNTSETIDSIHVSARDKINKKETPDNSAEQFELDETLKKLQIEKDLTNRQINKIKKELNEVTQIGLEQDKKIAYAKHRASILGNERQQQKIKQNFISTIVSFMIP